MALRRTPIHRALWRPILLFGADRSLILSAGMLAAMLMFFGQSILSAVLGIGVWFGSLYFLRQLAKADPQMVKVYLRHIQYAGYYCSRGHPGPIPFLKAKASKKRPKR